MRTVALITRLIAGHLDTSSLPTEWQDPIVVPSSTITANEDLEGVTAVTMDGRLFARKDRAGNTRLLNEDGTITCIDSDGRVWSL